MIENKNIFLNKIEEMRNPLNWIMLSDGEFKLEDLPPLIPLISIKDNGTEKPRVFTFGENIHDRLIIETENNHSYLVYENLHNGCGSNFCDEGYEFYNNGNSLNADYIEPNVKLINIVKLINDYDERHKISKLKSENKELRKIGYDYACQIENNYNALMLACKVLEKNDKAYKIKSKQKTAKQYYHYFMEKAKEE